MRWYATTPTDTVRHVLDPGDGARGGWRHGPHELALTLLGTASGETVYFANATRQATGVDRRFWIADAIASWRGSWRATRARAAVVAPQRAPRLQTS